MSLRRTLIKKASELPKGSHERKALLQVLARTSWMGINVESYSDRYVDPREVAWSWWDDLDKLVKEYWSLQKVRSGHPSATYMWFQLPRGVGGAPVEFHVMGDPSKGVKANVTGGDEKRFGPDASLKDIVLWLDRAAKSEFGR